MLQCPHFSFHSPSLSLSSISSTGCFRLPKLDFPVASRRREFRHLRSGKKPARWRCEIGDAETSGEEEGPILLPPPSSSSSSLSSSIFATTDDPSPLQVSASVLLTGAISVLLFRSLRRRAKRAKEMRVRSSGSTTTSLRDEAIESLKAMSTSTSSIKTGKSPSPVQALLGGIAAGVIALILYKFTITIEAALNRQAISDNFSVRQITVTIRTIINGLCYLATFIFGINGVGLVLYAGQLAISSLMAPPTADRENPTKISSDSDSPGETESRDE